MIRFEHRAVPIVLAAVFIDTIGFGIVLPVLPGLIVEVGRVDLAEATRIGGYLLVAFALAQFVAGPILGSLGDAIGRRPVLLAAMLAFAADFALMAWAPTMAWLFVGRLVAGGGGAVYGPANAVLADVTPPDRRGAAFGLMGAAFGTGFIVGPALGGLLAGWGTRAPFFAAAALALANAAAIHALLPETLDAAHRRRFDWRRAHAFGAFRPLLAGGGTTALLLAALLWQVAHMVYPATWAFFAEIALGWDATLIGWSLAATGLAMALTQTLVTGRVIARFGEHGAMLIGLVTAILVFTLYALVNATWQVFALLAIGSLTGLVWPSLNAILSRRVDAANQGALQGGMTSLASLAAIIGPLAMTQALATGAEHGLPGAAFLLAAALAAVTVLLVPRRRPRPSHEDAAVPSAGDHSGALP